MRATVNFEFDSSELETFATNLAVKSLAGVLSQVSGDPAAMQGVLVGMQQTIGMVLNGVATQQRQGPSPMGRVYMGYGPPPGCGPMGPGPGPMPYGSAGPVPQDPRNVRPIAEPATLEHCFSIEETRQNEAGWGCCHCAIINGLHRTGCRQCGHQRCGAVVTPPPPPEVP